MLRRDDDSTEVDVATDMALISAGGEYTNAAKAGAITKIATPFRAYWVHAARAKFGLLTDSAANRLVLGDWLRKALLEEGVRPTHVSLHVPILIELCLIPTDSDIYATEIRRTSERARRNLACGRPNVA
jgi:hypothetical protein